MDDYVCQVNLTQASSSRLTCITSKATNPINIGRLTLSIDGANRTLEGNPFNYTQDPTVMEIKPLKSFVSGGRMIFVHGSNLDSVQKPEMEVYFNNDLMPVNKTSCTVLNANQMECPSPAVNRQFLIVNRHIKRSISKRAAVKVMYFMTYTDVVDNIFISLQLPETTLNLRIGFVMDNVMSVRDLEKHFANLRTQISYVEDPKFFQFPNDIKSYKGDTLVIEGENLNMASDETDVVVTIGTRPCNVTSLAMIQLVCTPPEQQPSDTDENGIKVRRI